MVTSSDSDAVFKAIADPTRRAILDALEGGPLAVQSIAEKFSSMSRPAISKHLRILREAGLVGEEQQGRNRLYSLTSDRLAAVEAWVARFRGESRVSRRRSSKRPSTSAPRRSSAEADDWRVW